MGGWESRTVGSAMPVVRGTQHQGDVLEFCLRMMLQESYQEVRETQM